MGRNENDDLSAAQVFYPCMQAADIFFLKVGGWAGGWVGRLGVAGCGWGRPAGRCKRRQPIAAGLTSAALSCSIAHHCWLMFLCIAGRHLPARHGPAQGQHAGPRVLRRLQVRRWAVPWWWRRQRYRRAALRCAVQGAASLAPRQPAQPGASGTAPAPLHPCAPCPQAQAAQAGGAEPPHAAGPAGGARGGRGGAWAVVEGSSEGQNCRRGSALRSCRVSAPDAASCAAGLPPPAAGPGGDVRGRPRTLSD